MFNHCAMGVNVKNWQKDRTQMTLINADLHITLI